jgi:hypothetical protein
MEVKTMGFSKYYYDSQISEVERIKAEKWEQEQKEKEEALAHETAVFERIKQDRFEQRMKRLEERVQKYLDE